MRKILSWVWENLLFLETIFLLAFIPLFPKIPLLDVKNTWVYIRTEDFVILFVLISWLALLVKKKVSLKTPFTIPILIFWLIGAVGTIHAILIIFPTIANVFPNVAFFNLLRHIEYLSLFFIAYWGVRTKKQLLAVLGVLVFTLLAVSAYGFGQKYLGLPAYLTMNEEFAKGIPIQLSSLSRVPSTFAGHYDLAVYLVLVIPIILSLFFGFKNWFIKLFLLATSLTGFILLFMTVSRVSFFALFASLGAVIFFQKKKLFFFLVPAVFVLGMFFLTFQSSLFERFQKTVSEVEVLVDAKTGDSLGHVKYVPKEYFKDKIVLQRRVRDKEELAKSVTGALPDENDSTESAILRYKYIPEEVPLVTAVNISTGENLPQGTGYINLYLSPVTKRLGNFFYELPPQYASPGAQFLVIHGDFIVKKASAYDLSFTTRFQGEWPRAVNAFRRNILFGSGYGSISLAVDNNYLRVLGEIGLLGFVSFFLILLTLGIYIKKAYKNIDSKLERSFVIGFCAGVIGLLVNATLIDVFEASKIAFLLWILSGATIGILLKYQKEFDLVYEIKKMTFSAYAITAYLFVISWLLFSPILNSYFVGDDFTWLHWAANCSQNCNIFSTIASYFTDSNGFFFRPGAKVYFLIMYKTFWLNQVMYHLVSVLLHFGVSFVFFLIARKLFKNNLLSFAAASIFLTLSGPTEGVFWISTTGYLFTTLAGLGGLLFFILWEEKKKLIYFLLTLISLSTALLFHELGIVFPAVLLAYKISKDGLSEFRKNILKDFWSVALFIPSAIYLIIRFAAGSHWLSGDYSYDLLNLPFNFIGNAAGYLGLGLIGPGVVPLYNALREASRSNIIIVLIIIPFLLLGLAFLYRYILKKLDQGDRKIAFFGLSFFITALLPFLGLGNITSRYSYAASLGVVILLTLFIKKAWEYLVLSGKEIAVGALLVFIIVFSLFHIIQIQQTNFDWQDAGGRTKKFFVSFESAYSNNWATEGAGFHFVNVPIRIGSAWIFPVGLPDAVWFAIRNDSARIYIHNDLNSALNLAGSSATDIILKFNDDGSVSEIDRGLYK